MESFLCALADDRHLGGAAFEFQGVACFGEAANVDIFCEVGFSFPVGLRRSGTECKSSGSQQSRQPTKDDGGQGHVACGDGSWKSLARCKLEAVECHTTLEL